MRRLVLFASAVLMGCATPSPALDPNVIYLTVLSDPPGAQIYYTVGGTPTLSGFAPRVIKFPLTAADRANGKITMGGLSARWASGATRPSGLINGDLAIGQQMTFTIKRPEVAGLDVDLRFAVTIEQQQARRAESAQREEQARIDAAWGAIASGIEGFNAGRASAPTYEREQRPALTSPPTTIRCTTRPEGMFGRQLRTDCTSQ